MKITKVRIALLAFAFVLLSTLPSFSGILPVSETDHESFQQFYFYDTRDRETIIQITNTNSGPSNITIHVQIFNVDDDCNENNFYDTLTPNDTHVYNMGNIQTNNGNPSGVVLPDNAYGLVAITNVIGAGQASTDNPTSLIGNFRIIDDLGYEYRTNAHGYQQDNNFINFERLFTFNFSKKEGVILSDVIAILVDGAGEGNNNIEVIAQDIINSNISFDFDLYDVNETPFSCRDVTFACVDQDHPRLQELLELTETSVASFEYGINESIPHSKSGELLCPSNNVEEGFARFQNITIRCQQPPAFINFIGLNNGNGRGSMDSWFNQNPRSPTQPVG